MAFKKKSKTSTAIPTASMPDIIFMLLIFFMVTTVMKTHAGLPVKVPEAKEVKKVETQKKNIISIWIDKRNSIVCNDLRIKRISDLRNFVQGLVLKNPRSQIVIKMDYDAKMGLLVDVQQELRKAKALNVHYASRFRG
jgi:biopolymer transport protein ExbD